MTVINRNSDFYRPEPLLRCTGGVGTAGSWLFFSFLGRPTRPLLLPFLTYSSVGAGSGAAAVVGPSGFSFTCSPSESPSEYESAEFPDMTESRGVIEELEGEMSKRDCRNVPLLSKQTPHPSGHCFIQLLILRPIVPLLHTIISPSSSKQIWFRLIPLNSTPSLSPQRTTRPTRPMSPGSWPIPAQSCVTWYSLSRKCSNLSTALAPDWQGSSPSPSSSSCVSIAT